MRDRFQWARLLAFVTGLVNQELLLRNEYLAAENRVLRAHLPSRLRLSDPERSTLAEIARRLGRKALRDIACVAKPDTILGWYRRLVARKFDGSRQRSYPGRPRVSPEIEELVVRFARENRGWGYDRIVGALANLGHPVSDQTVGNILRRHNLAPAPERSRTTTWKEFIRSHMEVLAGADFFTLEVLTWRGLVTYYALFFIDVGSRRVSVGGITRHPDSCWMEQVARNATMQDTGDLNGCRYLLHDRDKKFCRGFRETLAAGGVKCTPIPARSPNLNAHAERWVRSIKQGMLIEADPFWRELVTACRVRFRGPLSPRKKPSGQRQSRSRPPRKRRRDPAPLAPGRNVELLLPGRCLSDQVVGQCPANRDCGTSSAASAVEKNARAQALSHA